MKDKKTSPGNWSNLIARHGVLVDGTNTPADACRALASHYGTGLPQVLFTTVSPLGDEETVCHTFSLTSPLSRVITARALDAFAFYLTCVEEPQFFKRWMSDYVDATWAADSLIDLCVSYGYDAVASRQMAAYLFSEKLDVTAEEDAAELPHFTDEVIDQLAILWLKETELEVIFDRFMYFAPNRFHVYTRRRAESHEHGNWLESRLNARIAKVLTAVHAAGVFVSHIPVIVSMRASVKEARYADFHRAFVGTYGPGVHDEPRIFRPYRTSDPFRDITDGQTYWHQLGCDWLPYIFKNVYDADRIVQSQVAIYDLRDIPERDADYNYKLYADNTSHRLWLRLKLEWSYLAELSVEAWSDFVCFANGRNYHNITSMSYRDVDAVSESEQLLSLMMRSTRWAGVVPNVPFNERAAAASSGALARFLTTRVGSDLHSNRVVESGFVGLEGIPLANMSLNPLLRVASHPDVIGESVRRKFFSLPPVLSLYRSAEQDPALAYLRTSFVNAPASTHSVLGRLDKFVEEAWGSKREPGVDASVPPFGDLPHDALD